MTEYEIVDAFYSAVNTANASLMNYVTIVFAMLVASYLAAKQLSRGMAFAALGMFTLFEILSVFQVVNLFGEVLRLGRRIGEITAAGSSDLAFHSANTGFGAIGLTIVEPFIFFTIIGSYAGAVWFFFELRRA
jgi:hypothetical protein